MRKQRDGLLREETRRPPDVRTMADQAGYGVGYLDFAFKSESRTHFRIFQERHGSVTDAVLASAPPHDLVPDGAGDRLDL